MRRCEGMEVFCDDSILNESVAEIYEETERAFRESVWSGRLR